MNMKRIVTGALILFVVVSLVVVIARNTTDNSERTIQGTSSKSEGTGLVAYYFHRTQRCPTCLRIEELAGNVVRNHFADQLKSGALKWRVVNIETEGNEHFETDFDLVSQSIVLVNYVNGEKGNWKNLDKIWELIGNEADFENYVYTELETGLQTK